MNNAQTFSVNSRQYAKSRPQYPDALFSFLRSAAPGHEQVWDCATGNGQAAVSLANHFLSVEATDISEEQISYALPHTRVNYSHAPAEHAPFNDASFDLICVAQAVHWFDLPKFFREADRVLKPNGVLAVCGYAFMNIDPQVDKLIDTYLLPLIDPFWAEGNRLVMNKYRDLTLPFEKINTPQDLSITVHWTMQQSLEYMQTWSAVKRYAAQNGYDPVDRLEIELKKIWKPGEVKNILMPLTIKASRKSSY